VGIGAKVLVSVAMPPEKTRMVGRSKVRRTAPSPACGRGPG